MAMALHLLSLAATQFTSEGNDSVGWARAKAAMTTEEQQQVEEARRYLLISEGRSGSTWFDSMLEASGACSHGERIVAPTRYAMAALMRGALRGGASEAQQLMYQDACVVAAWRAPPNRTGGRLGVGMVGITPLQIDSEATATATMQPATIKVGALRALMAVLGGGAARAARGGRGGAGGGGAGGGGAGGGVITAPVHTILLLRNNSLDRWMSAHARVEGVVDKPLPLFCSSSSSPPPSSVGGRGAGVTAAAPASAVECTRSTGAAAGARGANGTITARWRVDDVAALVDGIKADEARHEALRREFARAAEAERVPLLSLWYEDVWRRPSMWEDVVLPFLGWRTADAASLASPIAKQIVGLKRDMLLNYEQIAAALEAAGAERYLRDELHEERAPEVECVGECAAEGGKGEG